MSVTFRVASTPAPQADADLLAVPVFAERVLGPGAEALNRALGEGLPAFMEEAGFEGKVGETLAVPTAGALGARAALLVGMGPADDVTVDGIRAAAAALARKASQVATVATTLVDAAPAGVDRAAAAQALAEGVLLGGYQYLAFKSAPTPSKLAEVIVLGRGGAGITRALERGAADRDGSDLGARCREPSRRRAAAGRVRGVGAEAAAGQGREGRGARRRGDAQGEAGRRARRRAGLRAAAAARAHDLLASRGARHGRARRQGRGVRLRWPLAQDRGRHGDDEDRHVGRGHRHRDDVGAEGPRREDQGHRPDADGREHAERFGDPAG